MWLKAPWPRLVRTVDAAAKMDSYVASVAPGGVSQVFCSRLVSRPERIGSQERAIELSLAWQRFRQTRSNSLSKYLSDRRDLRDDVNVENGRRDREMEASTVHGMSTIYSTLVGPLFAFANLLTEEVY